MFRQQFEVRDYSLDETLASGQAFRWKKSGESWEGTIRNQWIRLTQKPGGIEAEMIEHPQGWKHARHYLQLEVDYPGVIASFPKDEHLMSALQACQGLRLLRQEPWECLASFILSSTKQIVQIQQIVQALCDGHGEQLASGGERKWRSFPEVERVAEVAEEELRRCKMGFRAPYLKGSAELIARGDVDLKKLEVLPTPEAREELLKLPGVGRKIADCVLLFAYGRQDAFPVDVWVMRILRERYFPKRKPSAARLQRFIDTYFGINRGYAQQFLFQYIRTKERTNS